MNIYRPRQVAADEPTADAGLWRFTCKQGPHLTAAGYCMECPGHETADGAAEHYKEWLLDNRLSLMLSDPADPRPCRYCGQPTDRKADLNGQVYWLCPAHNLRQIAAELHGPVLPFAAEW